MDDELIGQRLPLSHAVGGPHAQPVSARRQVLVHHLPVGAVHPLVVVTLEHERVLALVHVSVRQQGHLHADLLYAVRDGDLACEGWGVGRDGAPFARVEHGVGLAVDEQVGDEQRTVIAVHLAACELRGRERDETVASGDVHGVAVCGYAVGHEEHVFDAVAGGKAQVVGVVAVVDVEGDKGFLGGDPEVAALVLGDGVGLVAVYVKSPVFVDEAVLHVVVEEQSPAGRDGPETVLVVFEAGGDLVDGHRALSRTELHAVAGRHGGTHVAVDGNDALVVGAHPDGALVVLGDAAHVAPRDGLTVGRQREVLALTGIDGHGKTGALANPHAVVVVLEECTYIVVVQKRRVVRVEQSGRAVGIADDDAVAGAGKPQFTVGAPERGRYLGSHHLRRQ